MSSVNLVSSSESNWNAIVEQGGDLKKCHFSRVSGQIESNSGLFGIFSQCINKLLSIFTNYERGLKKVAVLKALEYGMQNGNRDQEAVIREVARIIEPKLTQELQAELSTSLQEWKVKRGEENMEKFLTKLGVVDILNKTPADAFLKEMRMTRAHLAEMDIEKTFSDPRALAAVKEAQDRAREMEDERNIEVRRGKADHYLEENAQNLTQLAEIVSQLYPGPNSKSYADGQHILHIIGDEVPDFSFQSLLNRCEVLINEQLGLGLEGDEKKSMEQASAKALFAILEAEQAIYQDYHRSPEEFQGISNVYEEERKAGFLLADIDKLNVLRARTAGSPLPKLRVLSIARNMMVRESEGKDPVVRLFIGHLLSILSSGHGLHSLLRDLRFNSNGGSQLRSVVMEFCECLKAPFSDLEEMPLELKQLHIDLTRTVKAFDEGI